MELQRHSPQQSLVEIMRGELRIGKEMNMFQELLKEYYYTGFFVGTLSFAFFYLLVWSFIIRILDRTEFFRFWYGLEEPDCDLDLDFSLGGIYHDQADGMRERREWNREDEQEPRFEDWHDLDEQSPPVVDRSVPVVPDSPQSSPRRDHHDGARRANSEEDWEDIFYPATDG